MRAASDCWPRAGLAQTSDRSVVWLVLLANVALPPKADTDQQGRDVRFGPKADTCTATINASLRQHSVSAPLS
jgi:hypothetical protein